jgi:hypothetical protein
MSNTSAARELFGRDVSGVSDYTLPFPVIGQCTYTTLAANVEQTVTTPAGYNRAFFSYSSGANVFVNLNATAAAPSGSFAATTWENY